MSPFSELFSQLRRRHGLRQAELAERLGYEQSYISALEVGLKGPPTDEFLERFSAAMALTAAEQESLLAAARASQRKLVIDADAPADVFWLLNDLRDRVLRLSPTQVRMIRDVISFPTAAQDRPEPTRRIRRRRKEEFTM